MTKDHKFNCSFCGLERRQVRTLISGPAVFICDECVGVCVDVLADQKSKGKLDVFGERVDVAVTATAERDAAQEEVRKLKQALREAGKAIADGLGQLVTIRCMWCDVEQPSEEAAKEHVGACAKHPAVIKLAEFRNGKAAP